MAKTSDNYWIICPYCGEKHGDAWEWVKGEDPQRAECQSCERPFVCWAEYDVTYCARDIEGGALLKAVLQQKDPTT